MLRSAQRHCTYWLRDNGQLLMFFASEYFHFEVDTENFILQQPIILLLIHVEHLYSRHVAKRGHEGRPPKLPSCPQNKFI